MRARDGGRPGGRRPVRRGPDGQPAPGAGGRAARQGGGALRARRGHMANQLALKLFTRPGDDVVVSRESHAVWHETGAAAANAGVQFTEVGAGGVFTAEDVPRRAQAARTPASTRRRRWSRSRTPTTAPAGWSSRRRAGADRRRRPRARGRLVPRRRPALERGGRARRRPVAELAAPFDLVVDRPLEGARRARRVGARRPPGRTSTRRPLPADARRGDAPGRHPRGGRHLRARAQRRAPRRRPRQRPAASAERPRGQPARSCSTRPRPDEHRRLPPRRRRARCGDRRRPGRERGVLVFAFGPRTVRAVTHLDVTRDQCARAARILVEAAEAGRPALIPGHVVDEHAAGR